MKTKVGINGAEFYAFHGFYEEERLLGNYFIINLKVGFRVNHEKITLENTVNYEGLLELVKDNFKEVKCP